MIPTILIHKFKLILCSTNQRTIFTYKIVVFLHFENFLIQLIILPHHLNNHLTIRSKYKLNNHVCASLSPLSPSFPATRPYSTSKGIMMISIGPSFVTTYTNVSVTMLCSSFMMTPPRVHNQDNENVPHYSKGGEVHDVCDTI